MRLSPPSLITAAAFVMLPSAALAQQTFRDSAQFLAALDPATVITQGFEDAQVGTLIPDGTEFGGLTWYYSTLGENKGGLVGDGSLYRVIDTQGLFLERDGIDGPGAGDYFYSGEAVTITFPEPVQAVGIFVNVLSFDVPDYVFLNTSHGSAYSGGLVSEETVYPGLYFVGLIADEPLITKAQFGVSDAVNAGWNADNLISGNAAGGGECYADINGDGVLDLFDFLQFTNLFNNKDAAADCDPNQVFNLFNFLCFTNEFSEGC